jgi:hypothetical protein
MSEYFEVMRRASCVVLVSVLLAACGSGNGPASPTPGGQPASLSGRWVEIGGGSRTWTLEQGSIQAGGPASFSQRDNPNFGVVSGTGGVLGTVFSGSFMFAETYESLVVPSRPSPNSCYIDTNGQLSINGDAMTGSYTETAGCAGVRVGQVTRSLTMRRQ